MTDLMTNMWIAIPGAIFIWFVGLFIATFILQWLWNMTMPDVFDIKKITYWQAFRLLIIAGIIFKDNNMENKTFDKAFSKNEVAILEQLKMQPCLYRIG